ncbi:MAG TPA: metallophosphoesterase family protein [Myxococcota bacterium]|nr:metallophosphoesterase family protein [Myxococcota bacterium]
MSMNRRKFLQTGGRLALGAGAAALLPRRARAQSVADVENAELVTITEDGAVITWESLQATEGLVAYGPSADRLDSEVGDPAGRTRYHRVELTGLPPGQPVHYVIRADGADADPVEYSPGVFDTLGPPPGTYLFTFATITDMHVGLTSAGAVSGLGDFVPVECPLVGADCWQVANQAVVEAINKSQAEFTLVKGDLSHEYASEQFEAARSCLEQLEKPYHPVRGNHDRQGERPEDYYKKVMQQDVTHYAFSHQGARFAILDSSNLATGFPEVGEEQWVWLADQLDNLGDERLFVVLHHPVTDEASVIFTLFTEDQQRLFSLLEREKNVAAILSGHSHRNIVTHQPELGDVPCIETACSIHYPGGYNLYRVYTGGFMQTYHKINGEQWRQWEEAGRQMYNGDAQELLLGSSSDRNFVCQFMRPLPEPETPQEGCACGRAPHGGGLALGATALAAMKLAPFTRKEK